MRVPIHEDDSEDGLVKVVTFGDANEKLKRMLDNAAIQLSRLQGEQRERWNMMIQSEVIIQCAEYRLRPVPYLRYYKKKVKEYDEKTY